MHPRSAYVILIVFANALLSFSCREQQQINERPTELDFMIGDWLVDAKIKISEVDYLEGKGNMKVFYDSDTIKAEMDIKFEEFEVVGVTKRIFNHEKNKWDISWNPPDESGRVPDIEGQMKDDRFIEVDLGKDEYGAFLGRLVVYDMSNDHFSVRKDKLYDNGGLAKEIWVYEANRKK